MTAQDPELSAALGWPGGASDPVLDRKTLLQMVAALRVAAQQALEALLNSRPLATEDDFAIKVRKHSEAITALRAALAQQAEPDLSRCPQCNGPADNGFDRSFPPSPYLCTKCMAEPVAWMVEAEQTLHQRVIYPELQRLRTQRDALLEVLKYLDKEFRQHGRQHWPEAVRVRAAIKAVEEGK